MRKEYSGIEAGTLSFIIQRRNPYFSPAILAKYQGLRKEVHVLHWPHTKFKTKTTFQQVSG